jgi:OOP family OmpA-OmpF porin
LGTELVAFEGDAAPFERARAILESCLVTQFRPRPRGASFRGWLLVTAVVLLALGTWMLLSLREQRQWNGYVERLQAEPGIVVLASGRRNGRFFVGGLRDPLARDPFTLVAPASLALDAIDSRWEPYQALYPAFVAARAGDLLRPPSGVVLDYRDGVLTASGAAPGRWIAESARLAPAIAGVRKFVYAGTAPEARLKERLEAVIVRFAKGQSRIERTQEAALADASAILNALDDTLNAMGRRAQVELVGHTDADGSDSVNGPLSQARAAVVLKALDGVAARGALDLSAVGVGTAAPIASGGDERDKERNRSVSFRVRIPGV